MANNLKNVSNKDLSDELRKRTRGYLVGWGHKAREEYHGSSYACYKRKSDLIEYLRSCSDYQSSDENDIFPIYSKDTLRHCLY